MELLITLLITTVTINNIDNKEHKKLELFGQWGALTPLVCFCRKY